MADVDFGDSLDYLANERKTRAILLYIEAISHPRKFMSAARAAARMKPVIVVKACRYEQSAQAATSHTGALAGIDEVYDTAFRRAGIGVLATDAIVEQGARAAELPPDTIERLNGDCLWPGRTIGGVCLPLGTNTK